MERKSCGRPLQRVSPNPRQRVVRPVPNPTIKPSRASAFTAVVHTAQRIQEPAPHSFSQACYMPMSVPFHPKSSQAEYGMKVPMGQQGFLLKDP